MLDLFVVLTFVSVIVMILESRVVGSVFRKRTHEAALRDRCGERFHAAHPPQTWADS